MRRISGSAASAAAAPSRLLRPSTRMVARCAISSACVGVLLHHGDRDAVAVDRLDGGEQRLGGDRRQPGRGLVEQQQHRLHHQRHRHREHLTLAAGQRARRAAAALGQHRESARTPRRYAGASRQDRASRPSPGFRAPTAWRKMFCSCGTKATPRRLDLARRQTHGSASPRSVMLPCSGCSSPAMVFSSVDLPAPFGPMMATISLVLDRQMHALEDLVAAAIAGDDVADHQQAHRRRPI